MNIRGIFLNVNGTFVNLRHVVSVYVDYKVRTHNGVETVTVSVMARDVNDQAWRTWSKSVVGDTDKTEEEADAVVLELVDLIQKAHRHS